MPQLVLGLGAQIKGSNSFDPDALRYFATAGVTGATGRSQINTFVRGIKSLGLYNNMVCWPLRSTQNAGTGVTAYSLGGFGVYNGTLTNGPTWGTGGITFDGTNDYILTTFTTGLSEFTAFSAATPESKLSLQLEMAKDKDATARDWGIFTWNGGLQRSYVFNPTSTLINGPAHQTTIRSLCLRASSSVNKLRRNNESDFTGAVGTLTQSTAAVGIASSSIGERSWFQGTISASILFNTALSDANTSSVYTLYSTTLGSGLGLP